MSDPIYRYQSTLLDCIPLSPLPLAHIQVFCHTPGLWLPVGFPLSVITFNHMKNPCNNSQKEYHAYFLVLSLLAFPFITLKEFFVDFLVILFYLYSLRFINIHFLFVVEIVLLCYQVTQSI